MQVQKNGSMLLVGILAGMALAGPVANAATEYFQAQRTPHSIYVDGRRVALEAYAINGSNYVKLRDIGQVVGFEVYWDGSAAQVVSDKPYTGQPPIQAHATTAVPPFQDYTGQTNSAVFTPVLTKEMYQGLQDAMLHQCEVATGTYTPITLGTMSNEDYTALHRDFKVVDILDSLSYEYSYVTTQRRDGTVLCSVSVFEPVKAAIEQVSPFISDLAVLTQREKVEEIVWYICDHLTYNVNSNSGPTSEVFADGAVIEGRCETYAEWMKLLCEQAGIPCIQVRSSDHRWNCVYVDGIWWDVDACWDDESKRIEAIPSQVEAHRRQATVFHEPGSWVDEHHKPCNPDSVLFAKELLVPGSTK